MGGTGLLKSGAAAAAVAAGFHGRDSVSKGCQMESNDWLSVAKGGTRLLRTAERSTAIGRRLAGPAAIG